MRPQSKNIFPEFFNDEADKSTKSVQHYRDLYKTRDDYLQRYPEIERLAHENLKTLCKSNPTRDRPPEFTTQNLFRAVLVMKMQNLSPQGVSSGQGGDGGFTGRI